MRVRILPSFFTCGIGSVALAGMVACGGGGNGGGPDATPPVDGSVVDADPNTPDAMNNGVCEEGGRATTDGFLPQAVGNTWRYRVDNLDGMPPAVKTQSYTEMITPDEQTGEVIVQVTANDSGTTESWFQRQGDRIVRLQQQDFDQNGALERTTVYLPHRLRLDESPARLETGATWTENYVREERSPLGAVLETENNSEEWSVINGDMACPGDWSEHRCIHLRRRTLAGTGTEKQYWFARGYGKIREEGGVVEELLGCTLK
jgi:hypothetical protein